MLHMLPESYPGFPLPATEYYFARQVGRRWRFDYAWPQFSVALEVEGGIFGKQIVDEGGQVHRVVQSRHTDPIGMAEDCRKYNQAAILGWLVLRATDHTIKDRTILNDVVGAMRARGWRELGGRDHGPGAGQV
jgi:hypothetical protein